MLISYSDDAEGKSDLDGDGIYFVLRGIPSMGNIMGVFNIDGTEYKFIHMGVVTLDKLVIEEVDIGRLDGTTYTVSAELNCR